MPHKSPTRQAEYDRQRYEANRETVLERRRLFRQNEPEKFKASLRADYAKHRDRRLAQKRAYHIANADKLRAKSLMNGTGFTPELKRQRMKEQGDKCAICQIPFKDLITKNIHADHCHATGALRGVLCRGCNLGLGKFKDSPDALRRALEYLLKYQMLG